MAKLDDGMRVLLLRWHKNQEFDLVRCPCGAKIFEKVYWVVPNIPGFFT